MRRQIAVIGGGPAGLEAASAAAIAGAQVTLVSESHVGGRAGWDSLTPSKVWLGIADLLGNIETAGRLGLTGLPTPHLEAAAVLARIQAVAEGWSAAQTHRLAELGVTIITGLATFNSPHEIEIKDDNGNSQAHIKADATIIAAGSAPRFPAAMRPDGKQILAPRHMSMLQQLPPDMVMIGGGATGAEFAYLFNRLGVRVTWVVDQRGVLPLFAAEAGRHLGRVLSRRGVELHSGAPAERIERDEQGVTIISAEGAQYRAASAFLAVGRLPDLARLNLPAAGLVLDTNSLLATDGYGRSAIDTIYAVGDAAGGPMLANRALSQARVAGRHAAGAPTAPYRPETVIHAIYSDPQLAQVGILDGPPASLQRVRVAYEAVLKPRLLAEQDGFLELAYNPQNRQICGAVAAGAHAADLLAPVALAIQSGATLEDLAAVDGAYPTISELVFLAARTALSRVDN